MSILTRNEVHDTPPVADWLARQVCDAEDHVTYHDGDDSADTLRIHQLVLWNWNWCWTKYCNARANGGDIFSRELVNSLFLEVRQAAWMVRLTAWSYRRQPGWDDTWFTSDDTAKSAP